MWHFDAGTRGSYFSWRTWTQKNKQFLFFSLLLPSPLTGVCLYSEQNLLLKDFKRLNKYQSFGRGLFQFTLNKSYSQIQTVGWAFFAD